jgi:hypothetical protein
MWCFAIAMVDLSCAAAAWCPAYMFGLCCAAMLRWCTLGRRSVVAHAYFVFVPLMRLRCKVKSTAFCVRTRARPVVGWWWSCDRVSCVHAACPPPPPRRSGAENAALDALPPVAAASVLDRLAVLYEDEAARVESAAVINEALGPLEPPAPEGSGVGGGGGGGGSHRSAQVRDVGAPAFEAVARGATQPPARGRAGSAAAGARGASTGHGTRGGGGGATAAAATVAAVAPSIGAPAQAEFVAARVAASRALVRFADAAAAPEFSPVRPAAAAAAAVAHPPPPREARPEDEEDDTAVDALLPPPVATARRAKQPAARRGGGPPSASLMTLTSSQRERVAATARPAPGRNPRVAVPAPARGAGAGAGGGGGSGGVGGVHPIVAKRAPRARREV